MSFDLKDNIQNRAEKLAHEIYDEDYFGLPGQTQQALFNRAADEIESEIDKRKIK